MSQDHDKYGKDVLLSASPDFSSKGQDARMPFAVGGYTEIDGVVGTDIAIEIESRVSKQVRGAILDLILHPGPLKLLVLLPVHMSNQTWLVAKCARS